MVSNWFSEGCSCTKTHTYYAGQGCVLQRWEPSVGLVWGLHMVELTWTFCSSRQMALVEIRPVGKTGERENFEAKMAETKYNVHTHTHSINIHLCRNSNT